MQLNSHLLALTQLTYAPKNRYLAASLIVGISTLCALLLVGDQILNARWGMIDDHGIFMFLEQRAFLPASEYFSTLWGKTEVGRDYYRFRPTYYAIRIAETVAFGSNVHMWYIALTAFLAVFIGAGWYSLNRFLPFWIAGLLMAPIVALPFWGDVWSRLGPSEIYGAPALAVMSAAISYLLTSSRPSPYKIVLGVMAVATVVLIGAKETFLPFVSLPVVAILYAYWRRRVSGISVIVFLAVVLTFLSIILVRVAGSRSLGEASSPLDLKAILIALVNGQGWHLLWLICSLLGAAIFFFFRGLNASETSAWLRRTLVALAVLVFLFAMVSLQYVGYQGALPTGTRYDFPAMLFCPVGLLVLMCYVFSQLGVNQRRVVSFFLFPVLLVWIVVGASSTWFVPLRAAVGNNIKTTSKFSEELSALILASKSDPSATIILDAVNYGAYEPIFSLETYLRAHDVQNPIAVSYSAATDSPIDPTNSETLKSLEQGNAKFTPLSEAFKRNCIVVPLGGPTKIETCAPYSLSW